MRFLLQSKESITELRNLIVQFCSLVLRLSIVMEWCRIRGDLAWIFWTHIYSMYVGLPYIITPAANCIGSVLFTSPSLVYRRLHKIIYTPTTWYMMCSMHKYVIVLFFSKIKLIILRHGWYICFSNYSTVTGNKTKTEEH